VLSEFLPAIGICWSFSRRELGFSSSSSIVAALVVVGRQASRCTYCQEGSAGFPVLDRLYRHNLFISPAQEPIEIPETILG
jgi:hypothetical protein